MSSQNPISTEVALPLVPPDIRALLGPPPVIWGERAGDFNALLERLAVDKRPESFAEWIVVHDIAVALWQERRIRHLRMAVVKQGTAPAAGELIGRRQETLAQLSRTPEHGRARLQAELDVLFAAGQGGQRRLRRSLKQAGLTEHDLVARAYAENLRILEVLDDEEDRAQRRRDKLIKDYDRRNQALGTRRERNRTLTLPVASPVDS